MARPASRHPTELELEILKILWRSGPSTGRQIRDALASFRDLAYTSVMTMLNIMTRKGYLTRSKTEGNFVYRARITEQSTSKRMLKDLVERVFEGSASALMLNLIETADLDRNELEQLRDLINKKAGEPKS